MSDEFTVPTPEQLAATPFFVPETPATQIAKLKRDLAAAKAKLVIAEKILNRLGHAPGCLANAFLTGCTCGLTAALNELRKP